MTVSTDASAQVWAVPRQDGWQLLIGTHEDGRYTERVALAGRIYPEAEALAWCRVLNARVVINR